MHLDQLRQCLDSAEQARPLLQAWGLRDSEGGTRNLADLARAIGLDAVRELCHPLGRLVGGLDQLIQFPVARSSRW